MAMRHPRRDRRQRTLLNVQQTPACISSIEALEQRCLLAADLPTLTVQALDATAAEPGSDGLFRIYRTGPAHPAIVISYGMGGTATSGRDYRPIGKITLGRDRRYVDVPLIVRNDLLVEGTETAVFRLASSSAYNVGKPNRATVAIIDNDPPVVSITPSYGFASENAGDTATFTLSRTGDTSTDLNVRYTTSGSAIQGTDYAYLGNLVIPAGESSASFKLSPIDDTITEGDETAIVALTADTGYALTSNRTFTAIIHDNDPDLVSVFATDPVAAEPGTDTGQFTFTRFGDLSAALTINYSVSGTATYGVDYEPLQSVTFAEGQSAVAITLTPIDDSLVEPDETVDVTVSPSPDYAVGTAPTASVTIHDDEKPLLSIATGDGVGAEPGTDTASFVITRLGSLASDLTLQYQTSGTATEGQDYTPFGTITLPAGQSTVTVTLHPLDDTLVEGDETVVFTLLPDPAYDLGTPTDATAIIQDNEPGGVSVTASIPDAAEPNVNGEFTFTRTGDLSSAITLNYQMQGSAVAGSDFQPIGTITIPANTALITVPLVVINDSVAEDLESTTLQILPGTGYTVSATNTATIFIHDDDAPTVTVVATVNSARETPNESGTYTFTRNAGNENDLTIQYAMSGTATEGQDYPSLGTIVIPAGSDSVSVDLTPVADGIPEDSETAILTILPDPAYALGGASSATITIRRSDLPIVTVGTSDSVATEVGQNDGSFTVSRSGPVTSSLTLSFVMEGTADNGVDYQPITSITIPAGASSVQVPLIAIDDNLPEGTETAILHVLPTSQYDIADGADTATVLIQDNESPLVTVVATVTNTYEGSLTPAGFTITRTGDTASPLQVSYLMQGTASLGADYNNLGTIVIPAGQGSVLVPVYALTDTLTEGDESVTLYVVGSQSMLPGTPDHATVFISDLTLPSLSGIVSANASEEGPTAGSITITRLGSLDQTITLDPNPPDDQPPDYTLSGTATEGVDYEPLGKLVIPAGQSTLVVPIVPIDDNISETTEWVTLTLNPTDRYTVSLNNAPTMLILDNDPPTVHIAAPDPIATETQLPVNDAVFSVWRTGDISQDLTVFLDHSGTATSPADYSAIPSIVIPAGQTYVQFAVRAIDDTIAEDMESIIYSIADDPSYIISPSEASATAYIQDNDTPVVNVQTTSSGAAEENTVPGVFTVTRQGDLSQALPVDFTLTGTAVRGVDYVDPGAVVIPAGQASVDVVITPIDDGVSEGPESVIFNLQLTDAYSAGTDSTASMGIQDNDPPQVSVYATGPYASEAGQQGAFTFTRVGDQTQDLVINYALSGSATEGSDYQDIGTIVIPANQPAVTVSLVPIDDTLPEPTETATLTILASDSYVSGADASATVSILDNDDVSPPTAARVKIFPVSAGTAPAEIGVIWVDNTLVSAASLGAGDLLILGPGGFQQTVRLASRSSSSDAPSITAYYTMVPPGRVWDARDNGVYSVYVQPNQVKDTSGNAASPRRIGRFLVRIPTTSQTSTRTSRAAVRPALATATSSASVSLFNTSRSIADLLS